MIDDIDFSKEHFQKVLNGLYEGVYAVDADRRIRFWNSGAERITGYSAKEVEGSSCGDGLLMHVDGHGNELCHNLCPLALTLRDNKSRQDRIYLHHKDGHRLPVAIRIVPIQNKHRKVVGAIEIFSEITSQVQLQQRIDALQKMALLDALTELPNRRYLEDQIRVRLEEYNRYGNGFGILFLDIDHFKKFNDKYGHEKGDQVLKVVAKTLSYSVRASDVIGRWGGEEFLGVFPNISEEELFRAGKRLLSLVEHSKVKVSGQKISATVSIGAAYINESDTVDSIVKRADAMMYKSKRNGRNRITAE